MRYILIIFALVFAVSSCDQKPEIAFDHADKDQVIQCDPELDALLNEALYVFEENIRQTYDGSTLMIEDAYDRLVYVGFEKTVEFDDIASKKSLEVRDALIYEGILKEEGGESNLNYSHPAVKCVISKIEDKALKSTIEALIETNTMNPKLLNTRMSNFGSRAAKNRNEAFYVALDTYYQNLVGVQLVVGETAPVEDEALVADAVGEAIEVVEKTVVEDPVIETLPSKDTLSDLSEFTHKILKNDTIMYWKTGDINNDRIDDFIVVLESKQGIIEVEGYDDTYTERLVILLETIGEYPNFKLRGLNDAIIGCSNCGGAGVGDPFQGVVIKGNYFSIEQLYGACTKSFEVRTYKYDISRDNWFLHKLGSDTYSCNSELVNGEIPVEHTEETKKDFGEVAFTNKD